MVDSFTESSQSSHHRVKHLFIQAIACPSQRESLEFISRQCGTDIDLRRSLERLLDAHWKPKNSFVEKIDETYAEQIELLKPGQCVRDYKIEKLVGEGGMGLVYLAHQESPFERKVAIKVLKRGIDTREVLKRFIIEQQALATLDHVHIARIIDGGQTESGLPYFVMEYVDGRPVTLFCDEQKLSIHERLRLWLDAAEAVQHAHRCGILHRDLKPSNMLVTLGDGEKATLKVIDFGLAKLSEVPPGFSIVSHVQAGMGTPRYMSPEQKGIIDSRVDTRTDIFAMGMVLRELLIGNEGSPSDSERQAPSKQYLGLSTLLRSKISSLRSTDNISLVARLRGELDWIVLKSLAVNPDQRYQSMAEFADDVTAHVNGLFVHARPPSVVYRWRKSLSKHRVLASFLLFAFLAVLAVAAISRKQTLVARNAEQHAKNMADLLSISQRRTQQLLYASELRLAGEAWLQGDTLESRKLLDRHSPNPNKLEANMDSNPGIEWFFLDSQLSRSRILFKATDQQLEHMAAVHEGICFQANDSQTWFWNSRRHADTASATTDLPVETQNGNDIEHDLVGPQKIDLSSSTVLPEWNAITSSNDGKRLAVGSGTGFLNVYDIANRKLILECRLPQQEIFSLSFLNDSATLAVGTARDILVVNVEDGQIRERLIGHQDDINALSFAPKEFLLVSASEDRHSIVWNPSTCERVATSPIASHRLTATAIHSSGDFWIDADVKGRVRMLSASSRGEVIHQWLLPSAIDCIALSQDEKRLAVGCRSGSVHILNLEDVATRMQYPIATELQIPVHTARVTSLIWDSKDTIISTGRDGCLRRTTVQSTNFRTTSQNRPVMRCCVSPDGRFVGYSDAQGIYVYNTDNKETERVFPIEEDAFCSTLAMNPAAPEMIAVTREGSLFRFALQENRKQPSRLIEHREIEPPLDISQLEYSADGKRILAASRSDNNIRIYEKDFSRQVFEMEFKGSYASLSANGRWIAINRDRDVLVFDADSGKLIKRSTNHHNETVTSLAFSPDSHRIITTSDDRSIRSWAWNAKKEPEEIGVHPDGVPKALAISSDGRTAVTCSRNGQAWLWSLDVGQKLVRIASSAKGFESCVMSGNDRILVLQENGGELILIPLRP